jgi:hypothetical protein
MVETEGQTRCPGWQEKLSLNGDGRNADHEATRRVGICNGRDLALLCWEACRSL